MSFGSWDGKMSKKVDKEDLMKWRLRDPGGLVGPTNGETLGEIGTRVEKILNELCHQYQNCTIVLVTHAYVIKAALDHAMNLPDGYHANRLWLDTSTTTIIDWSTNPEQRIVHRVNWSPILDHGSNKWTQM